MRRVLAGLVLASLLAGCVQVLESRMDEARNGTPNESNATNVTGSPASTTPTASTPATTPPLSTTPTPSSTPPPASTPASTPTPAATPTPVPAPTPTPTPSTPAAQPWPHEGSYVRYTMERLREFTGTSEQWWHAYANASWTYHDGDWSGSCDGMIYDHTNPYNLTVVPVHRDYVASSPPHWPPFDTRTPPAVGENVTTWFLSTCAITNATHPFAGGNATTFRASEDDPPFAFRSTWSRETGLVLDWWDQRYGLAPSLNRGGLVATDAPVR